MNDDNSWLPQQQQDVFQSSWRSNRSELVINDRLYWLYWEQAVQTLENMDIADVMVCKWILMRIDLYHHLSQIFRNMVKNIVYMTI